jgi:PAS domain S-box-containing protein
MTKTLWEILWEYDPNGLVVLDENMQIKVVNPAFCRMFGLSREGVIDQDASLVLGDLSDFEKVWQNQKTVVHVERQYPDHSLYVRQIIFSVENENLVACIMVDITTEWMRENEIRKLKKEALEKVTRVVDKQMQVAQEIAGLLGETTAETKVSLLRMMEIIEQENT